ncbi:MAG: flippase-like domain-containing protein [Anaerolineaceae bacterium]|nr:flippase-like domain-containing protein [Anaerolineaceae bacterium]
MTENSRSAWSDFRRWLPGVIISLIALYTVFKLASWQDLSKAFSTIRIGFLIPGLILVTLWLVIRAVTWRTLLEGKVSLSQTFRAINIGYLLNNLLPLRAGELGRAIVLGKSSGLGTSNVLSTIVIERAFDLAFAAGLLLSTLPLALEMEWAKSVAIITLSLVFIGLLVLFLVANNSKKVQEWIEKYGTRWRISRKYILPQLTSLLTGLEVLTNPRRFLLCLLLSGSSWVIAVIFYYVMLLSIAPDAPLWWAIFSQAVLAMGIALPSAPAALGVFEASMVGGLTILGVDYSKALAYAILMHFMQFLVTGIFGFISLAKERHSIGSLFSETRRKNE